MIGRGWASTGKRAQAARAGSTVSSVTSVGVGVAPRSPVRAVASFAAQPVIAVSAGVTTIAMAHRMTPSLLRHVAAREGPTTSYGSLLATAAAEAWYTSGDVVDSVIADRWAKAAAVSETR
ncbi:MAG: hypothetical protein ACRDTX_25750 [Pseudonocardiaceae bacterium]